MQRWNDTLNAANVSPLQASVFFLYRSSISLLSEAHTVIFVAFASEVQSYVNKSQQLIVHFHASEDGFHFYELSHADHVGPLWPTGNGELKLSFCEIHVCPVPILHYLQKVLLHRALYRPMT
jgi:hypothetical protein